MNRQLAWICVFAIGLGAAVAIAQPPATDEAARAQNGNNPSEAQERGAEELRRVSESAERTMRIERARRVAPIDLWFGIR